MEYEERKKGKEKTSYQAYRNVSDDILREAKPIIHTKEDVRKQYFYGQTKSGTVSITKEEDKKLDITITARNPYGTRGKEQDSERVNEQSNRYEKRSQEEVKTNSHEPKDSAVEMKISYEDKAPEVIMERLKNLAQEEDTYAERALPFLNERRVQMEQRNLERLRECVSDQHTKETIENSLESIQYDIQHKEREERRLLDQIRQSIEMMNDEKDLKKHDSIKRVWLEEIMEEQTDDGTTKPWEDENHPKSKDSSSGTRDDENGSIKSDEEENSKTQQEREGDEDYS